MSKSKNDCAHEICRPRLSLDGGDLLLPGSAVGDFVFLPEITMADAKPWARRRWDVFNPFFGIAIFIALMFMFVRFVHTTSHKKDIFLRG